ncbi:hypothetical protein D3Z47_11705 [Lachnospiraceae bacterium]|nr:hypothetical protein [Lachnospiraceae bacterium]
MEQLNKERAAGGIPAFRQRQRELSFFCPLCASWRRGEGCGRGRRRYYPEGVRHAGPRKVRLLPGFYKKVFLRFVTHWPHGADRGIS